MENKLIPGLVSVTFRGMTTDDIVKTVKKNSLKAIEWGSDVHVPIGNTAKAEEVRSVCGQNGILIPSYGSYNGKGEEGIVAFSQAIDSAAALGAENIRIWAGHKDCEACTAQERLDFIGYASVLADMAKEKNLDVSFECHGGTLTNNPDSALRLIDEIGRDNVYLYWQPLQSEDIEKNKTILKKFLPHLKNVHVYNWKGYERFPLGDNVKAWQQYIDILKADAGKHCLLLEFVKNDSIEQLERDAEALLGMIEK